MRNWLAFSTISILAACGSDSKNPAPTVTCGTGTTLQGDTCVPDGSGTVTCGTGTHLVGSSCVADGPGTPGAPTISMMTPTEAGVGGSVLFQIVGTDLAGSDPSMVHVYFGDTTPSTAQQINPCEAEVASADSTTIAGEVPSICGDFVTTVTVTTDKGMASTAFHYDALFAVEGEGGGGELYLIDPFSELWGDLGPVNDGANTYKLDAIAFDGTGALWATTTGDNTGETTMQLATISLSFGGQTFGVLTPVGDLTDGTDDYIVSDMKFNGATLYGWGYNVTAQTESLVTISATGNITPVGTPITTTYGFAGFGIDGAGTMWVAPSGASADAVVGSTGELDTVDAAGAVTVAETLAYDPSETVFGQGAPIDALEYIPPFQAFVAVVDNGIYGQAVGNDFGTTLAFIDQTSGFIQTYFELPALTGQQSSVSALAWVPTTATIARHLPPVHWNKLAPATVINHH
jgi:hypothetical protein